MFSNKSKNAKNMKLNNIVSQIINNNDVTVLASLGEDTFNELLDILPVVQEMLMSSIDQKIKEIEKKKRVIDAEYDKYNKIRDLLS